MSEHPHMDSREPLLRIAKRDALPLWKNWAIRLAAVVLALLVCAVVVYATVKLSPLKVYAAMWSGVTPADVCTFGLTPSSRRRLTKSSRPSVAA